MQRLISVPLGKALNLSLAIMSPGGGRLHDGCPWVVPPLKERTMRKYKCQLPLHIAAAFLFLYLLKMLRFGLFTWLKRTSVSFSFKCGASASPCRHYRSVSQATPLFALHFSTLQGPLFCHNAPARVARGGPKFSRDLIWYLFTDPHKKTEELI